MLTLFDIADSLYSEAILLKKYNARSLLWRKNRAELGNKLREMRENVLALQILQRSDNTYAEEYIDLAEYMLTVIDECMLSLNEKGKNYRESVECRIWGFHNLPRAFMRVENPAHISAEQAREYFAAYRET